MRHGNEVSDLHSIENATAEFFAAHWDKASELPVPTWKSDWPWHGSVPYHNKGGVYALFNESGDILYIGLGASRGGGTYKEHGISRRLLAHVISTDKSKGRGYYRPKKKWSNVASIAAIGFPAEYSYLAASLEIYLIGKFNPPSNVFKKYSAQNDA